MSITTVEEFQKNAALLLAAVEQGEQIVIARGEKPVARMLPIEEDSAPDAERTDWSCDGLQNLSRAYSSD